MVAKLTLKRINLLLIGFILVNPFCIFLLSGNIATSILVSSVPILFSVFLLEIRKVRGLYPLWINLLAVVSTFLHAEVIFTYRFSDYIIEDLYKIHENYYFNKPYLKNTFQDKEYLVQYITNAQGFRIGVEDDPERVVKEADWLFLGDSFTQGAQVEYEELFTSRLFDHVGDKIIVNAGISGMGIADEYYYYLNEGKNLKANKVFLQICNFNDFMHVEKRNADFADYLMSYSNFARYILYDFKYANPAELPLGRWTEPFYPDQQSNKDYNVFYKEKSSKQIKDLENFKYYLKMFARAVKANNSELILIQIPTKEQISYRYFSEVIESFEINIDKLEMDFPNIFLSSICEEENVQLIDLKEDFSHFDQAVFFDFDEHLNAIGHEAVAKRIANYMRKTQRGSAKKSYAISTLNVGDRYPVQFRKDGVFTFQSWRDGNTEIFLADSTMEKNQRITWNKVDEIHPWPSPDGNSIIFTEGDQSTNLTQVVLMDIDGQNRKYITSSEQLVYGAIPSFNRTGETITYAEWKAYNNTFTNPYIVTFDLRTGNKSQITSDKYESWRPIFSPDNEKIYFISKSENKNFDIFEHSIKTKTNRNLTNSEFDEWDPAISNDGKTLIYAARKDDNWDLFALSLDSLKITRITKSKGDEWDPSFFDHDKYIYFGGEYGLRNGIFRMNFSMD